MGLLAFVIAVNVTLVPTPTVHEGLQLKSAVS
jgi:hypothetical protein